MTEKTLSQSYIESLAYGVTKKIRIACDSELISGTDTPQRYCGFNSRQPQCSKYHNKLSHTVVLVSQRI